MFPDRPRLRYTKAINPTVSIPEACQSGRSSSRWYNGTKVIENTDCMDSPGSQRALCFATTQGQEALIIPLRRAQLKRIGSRDCFPDSVINNDADEIGLIGQSAPLQKTTASPQAKRSIHYADEVASGNSLTQLSQDKHSGKFPPKALNTDHKLLTLSRSKTFSNLGFLSSRLSTDQPGVDISKSHQKNESVFFSEQSSSNGIEFFKPSPAFKRSEKSCDHMTKRNTKKMAEILE